MRRIVRNESSATNCPATNCPVTAFANGGSPLQGLYTLLLTLAFIAIMVLIIRPILILIHGYYYRHNDGTNVYIVVTCFLILVIAAFTTEVMGKFCKKKHIFIL
jgi:hypothetical protein